MIDFLCWLVLMGFVWVLAKHKGFDPVGCVVLGTVLSVVLLLGATLLNRDPDAHLRTIARGPASSVVEQMRRDAEDARREQADLNSTRGLVFGGLILYALAVAAAPSRRTHPPTA